MTWHSLSPVSVPSLQMTALPTLPGKTHSWPAVNFPLTLIMPLIGPRHGACYSALRRVNISKLHQKLRTSINLMSSCTVRTFLGWRLINIRRSYQQPLVLARLHIDHVYTDCARKIGILRRLQHKIRSTALRKIFIGAIRPTFEYACPVWSGGNTSKLVKLQELFCRPHQIVLPQLQQRCDYHTLVLFFKTKSNLAPPYLTELLPQLSSHCGYNFRKNLYPVPAVKKSSTLTSFLPRSINYAMEQLAIGHPEQHITPQV